MKFKTIDPRRLESIHGKKRKFGGNYFVNKRLKSMPPHSIGDDIDGGDIDGGDIDGGDIDGGDIGSDIGDDISCYQCI